MPFESNDGYYEVMWPRSPRQMKIRALAKRPDTLEGKTIAQLWDYMFRGDKIFEFIVQINAMGKTILMIEQNANLALQVARYGYVMATGKITHEAACAELREDDAIRRAYLGVTGATT